MNSISVNDGSSVDCKYGSKVLQAAIGNYRTRSAQALKAATNGPDNQAYKAIFKSDARWPEIILLWGSLANFPPGKGDESKATFRCIYSESEAQQLAPTAPNLWKDCRTRQSMGISEVGNVLFVCRPFFGFKDAYPVPMPGLCPAVRNNEFVERPDKHQFPIDKGIALTRAVAFYYGIKGNATHHTSVIEQQNDISKRSVEATARDLDSYLLFPNCGFILNLFSDSIPRCIPHI